MHTWATARQAIGYEALRRVLAGEMRLGDALAGSSRRRCATPSGSARGSGSAAAARAWSARPTRTKPALTAWLAR
jgi:hypothetical protein